MTLKIKFIINSTIIILNYIIFPSIHSQIPTQRENDHCQWGKYSRNKNATAIINGELYDTVEAMDDGLDAKVDHAFSPSLGHCVAIKHCSEQPERLNKCTRELEVLKALNGSTNEHLIKIFNFQIENGQNCMESGLWSDYLRMIVIGGDRRRRRRRSETEINNCTEITTVLELGQEDATHYWRKLKNAGNNDNGLINELQSQIQEALDEMHNRGLAHRDVHPDNVLIFPKNGGILFKLIDFGWSCCFDRQKCGPELGDILPACEKENALADDRFGLQDLAGELQKIK